MRCKTNSKLQQTENYYKLMAWQLENKSRAKMEIVGFSCFLESLIPFNTKIENIHLIH